VHLPALGLLALLGRIVGLGLERPWVKALAQGRDTVAATTFTFGVELLILIPLTAWVYVTGGASLHDLPRWIWFALASGMLYALGFHSYVYGLSVGEVSFLTPLFATAFVWLYVLDLQFGAAQFGWRPIAGILSISLGIVFLNSTSTKGVGSHPHPGRGQGPAPSGVLGILRQPGAWGMLTYAFCLATGRVIDSHGIAHAPVTAYALVTNSPAVLIGLGWLIARGRLRLLHGLVRERAGVGIASGVVGIGAYLLLLVAMAHGITPSVAEPISQLSVFISMWLGGLWFGEPVHARWLPAILLVLGAVLLVI
jgi:uncharacterized membrane protein